MADEKIQNSKMCGFYYDVQMSNPLLTATLHTNTYLADKPGGDPISFDEDPYHTFAKDKFHWEFWKKTEDKEDLTKGKVHCLPALTANYSDFYGKINPSERYRAKPLITSILTEDFQVEVGNTWGDTGGQTGLEAGFNKLKATGASAKDIAHYLKKITDKINEYTDKDENGNPVGLLGKANKKAGNLVDWVKNSGVDTLNSALITQGTRFSYYGGTTTTFGNLTMRFTLFADWVHDGSEWIFKSVHDQLREIYPYAVGKYHPLKANTTDAVTNLGVSNSTVLGTTEVVDDTLATYFGWQQPPAGYQSDIKSLDACQKGTLRLVLGGYYTAENLIINGMSINFSKIMTKIPPNAKSNTVKIASVQGKEIKHDNYETKRVGELTPLYADVTISLRPASSYSDTSIIKFSSNMGCGRFNYSQAKMRNESLQKVINSRPEE